MADTDTIDRFARIAQGCRANQERYAAVGDEAAAEQARMWGILAATIEEATSAVTKVPDAVQPIVASGMAVIQSVNARTLRDARAAEDRQAYNRRAYVPYSVLADLADAIEAAHGEGVWEKLGVDL